MFLLQLEVKSEHGRCTREPIKQMFSRTCVRAHARRIDVRREIGTKKLFRVAL